MKDVPRCFTSKESKANERSYELITPDCSAFRVDSGGAREAG